MLLNKYDMRRRKLSEKQTKKQKFRESKEWKEFREQKILEQKRIDPITNGRLLKASNCHHLCMDESTYDDISDPEKFMVVNKATHKVIHFLYSYYKKDPTVLNRIRDVLDRMVELNQ